jgi:uncharacterized membrane protein YidH (DUF202 family)
VENPAEASPKASLADYLAAERTLLAWIRTGLALMGFGFVLARFALFMGEIHVMQNGRSAEPSGFSLWSGTGLIAVGVIVNVFAGWHHLSMFRALDRGKKTYRGHRWSPWGLHSFWAWSAWRWRSTWFQFVVRPIHRTQTGRSLRWRRA